MSFSNTVYLSSHQIYQTGTDQLVPLGTRGVTVDGRVFRRAKAGAVALTTGKLMQESVIVSGHGNNLVIPAAVAVGASSITLTNSTTAITLNMYKEGFIYINDVDGEGQYYKIKSHPAESTGSGSCAFTIEGELVVALTTSSEAGLRRNPYDSIVINPTTATGAPVGVTVVAVAASAYAWIQTWGPCAVLTNGTIIVGKTVTPGASTAGSVDVHPLNSSDSDGQQPTVGVVSRVTDSTDYSWINLKIAP